MEPGDEKSPGPLRLAYVTNSELPGSTPGLSFAVYAAQGFRAAGADVEVILRGGLREPAEETVRRLFGLEDVGPICALRPPRLVRSNLLFYWAAFLRLWRSDRNVVIFRNANFLPWAAALKRRGKRVYFEAHDFYSDPALRGEPVRQRRQRYVALERRWLPHMDGILCTSEPQARLYRQCYPAGRVVTAATGCRPVWCAPRASFTHTLGCIGSINEEKYPLGIVMEGLARARAAHVRLLVVGAKGADQTAAVLARAGRLGLAGRVDVRGWATGEALARVEREIDVGVAVLTDSFWNRTASPLKILEYLSASLPFVATRLDGISALVRDGEQGLLVDNTPEAWAAAIDRIYADAAVYQRMAVSCGALAAELSWEARARRILDVVRAAPRGGEWAP